MISLNAFKTSRETILKEVGEGGGGWWVERPVGSVLLGNFEAL